MFAKDDRPSSQLNLTARANLLTLFKEETFEEDLQHIKNLIATLHQPHSVYTAFTSLFNPVFNVNARRFLHEVCFNPTQPLLWLLLDDNVELFLSYINAHAPQSPIDYLPTAICLNRVAIVDSLLANFRHQIDSGLMHLLIRSALFSANQAMLDKIYNFALKNKLEFPLNVQDLLTAIRTGNKEMVAWVLAKATPDELDISNHGDDPWDESIINAAAESGSSVLIDMLMKYGQNHGRFCDPIPSHLLYAIKSGNPNAVDHIEKVKVRKHWPKSFYANVYPGDVLATAAESGTIEMYEKIMKDGGLHGLNLTPSFATLLSAAQFGHVKLFNRILSELKADLNKEEFVLLFRTAAQSGRVSMYNRVTELAQQEQISVLPNLELLNAAASNPVIFNKVLLLIQQSKLSIPPTLDTLKAAAFSGNNKTVISVIEMADKMNVVFNPDRHLFVLIIYHGNIAVLKTLLKYMHEHGVLFNDDENEFLKAAKLSFNPLMESYIEKAIPHGIDFHVNEDSLSHSLSC